MHQLCGALPVPFVPVRVTRDALIDHRYSYSPPHCRTKGFLQDFYASLIISMLWDCGILRLRSMLLCWPELLSPFLILLFSLFISSLNLLWVGFVGLGSSTDRLHPLF